MTSTWLMMSRSPRPCQPSRATWLSGSSREPNLEVVRRTPLATARTLPCCSVIRVTIRSASPRRMVRSTTPRSRKRVIAGSRWLLGGRARPSEPPWPARPGRSGPRRRQRGPAAGRPGARATRPWVAAPAEQAVGGDEGHQHRGDDHQGHDRGEPGHRHAARCRHRAGRRARCR